MSIAELTIPAARLSRYEEPWDRPLAFVTPDDSALAELRLPDCPVLGNGRFEQPLVDWVDAVIEPPFVADQLKRQVLAYPHAAATLVQVLRVIRSLEPGDALVVESIAYAMLQGSAEHRTWLASRAPAPMLPAGAVEVTRHADELRITLARPEAGNAIDRTMRDALASALSLAALDPTLDPINMRAHGKAFSLGADLGEFGTTSDPATAHAIRAASLPARAAIACADRLAVHVDGACVGAGLELAAFAARLTATPRSWFQLPELAMGIIPGAGGCVSLPRRIGRQRTALMVLSGRRIGARQALAWGLVDALVDDPPFDDGGGDIA